MKGTEQIKNEAVAVVDASAETDVLLPLVRGRSANVVVDSPFAGVVIGELIAVQDDGGTALVAFPGQSGSAALVARSAVHVGSADVGRHVVLAFEDADRGKPIILGLLGVADARQQERGAARAEVDLDGERVTVSARQQLVLRCGAASITLTAAGKIIVQGAYISNRSSGVLRIKGGSVQIN